VPVACSAVFRQRVCLFPSCGAVFYLCPHCDRGQRYCSSRCRDKSRRRQRREANRRHQQSVEGRLDHRDRQRAYRRRLQARVTDQSSLRTSPCVNLTAPPVPGLTQAPPTADFCPWSDAEHVANWVVCQICGRRGRWVNPFPEVKHDCR
jgi:hypothetical protein